MLVVMIGIRKALDFVFTRRELQILDDVMPEIKQSDVTGELHKRDPESGFVAKFKRCCLGESPTSKQQKVIKSSNEKEFEAASSLLK